jgi:hypothetical protein
MSILRLLTPTDLLTTSAKFTYKPFHFIHQTQHMGY